MPYFFENSNVTKKNLAFGTENFNNFEQPFQSQNNIYHNNIDVSTHLNFNHIYNFDFNNNSSSRKFFMGNSVNSQFHPNSNSRVVQENINKNKKLELSSEDEKPKNPNETPKSGKTLHLQYKDNFILSNKSPSQAISNHRIPTNNKIQDYQNIDSYRKKATLENKENLLTARYVV